MLSLEMIISRYERSSEMQASVQESKSVFHLRHKILRRVTCNSFTWNGKDGDFNQFYALKWTKIRSKLYTRENVRAMLHPNKEIFKLKTPQLWTWFHIYQSFQGYYELTNWSQSNQLPWELAW